MTPVNSAPKNREVNRGVSVYYSSSCSAVLQFSSILFRVLSTVTADGSFSTLANLMRLWIFWTLDSKPPDQVNVNK